MAMSDSTSTKGDGLQKNAVTSAESGLKTDSQAGADQEPLAQAESGPSNDAAESEPDSNLNNESNADTEKKKIIYPTFQERIDQRRKEKGLPPIPRVPDRSGELEEGDVMLYSGITRHVIRRANTAVKYGGEMILAEIPTIQFAKEAGIPVPNILSFGEKESSSGYAYIEMEYIEGDTLEAVWETLSPETRIDMARQLGGFLKIMRALPPPPNFIGGFELNELRDFRHNDVFVRPACRSEEEFNAYLTEEDQIPPPLKRAFLEGIGTSHKIVFSHCDLAPRNIMVRDNRIVALIDWEAAGWYPEYWEFVKFIYVGGRDREWRMLVEEVFSETYDTELILYTGLLHHLHYFDPRKRVLWDEEAKDYRPYDEVMKKKKNKEQEEKEEKERKEEEEKVEKVGKEEKEAEKNTNLDNEKQCGEVEVGTFECS